MGYYKFGKRTKLWKDGVMAWQMLYPGRVSEAVSARTDNPVRQIFESILIVSGSLSSICVDEISICLDEVRSWWAKNIKGIPGEVLADRSGYASGKWSWFFRSLAGVRKPGICHTVPWLRAADPAQGRQGCIRFDYMGFSLKVQERKRFLQKFHGAGPARRSGDCGSGRKSAGRQWMWVNNRLE